MQGTSGCAEVQVTGAGAEYKRYNGCEYMVGKCTDTSASASANASTNTSANASTSTSTSTSANANTSASASTNASTSTDTSTGKEHTNNTKVDNFIVSAYRLARRLQSPIFEYAEHEPSKLLEIPSFMTPEELNQELLNILSYTLCALGFTPKNISPGLITNLGWFKEDSGEELVDILSFVEKLRNEEFNEKKSLDKLIPKTHSRFSKFFKFENALNLLDKSRIALEDFSKVKDFCKEKEISLLKDPIQEVEKNLDSKWKDLFGEAEATYLAYEFSQPFKDYRKPYRVFVFSKNSNKLETLVQNHLYWGVVSKLSPFGAFIDIGAGVEGLVHLSELSDEFISDPRKILRLDQWVLVKLIKVDTEARHISLSKTKVQKRSNQQQPNRQQPNRQHSTHLNQQQPNQQQSNRQHAAHLNQQQPNQQQSNRQHSAHLNQQQPNRQQPNRQHSAHLNQQQLNQQQSNQQKTHEHRKSFGGKSGGGSNSGIGGSNSGIGGTKGNQKFKGQRSDRPSRSNKPNRFNKSRGKKNFKELSSKTPFNNPFASALGDLNQD